MDGCSDALEKPTEQRFRVRSQVAQACERLPRVALRYKSSIKFELGSPVVPLESGLSNKDPQDPFDCIGYD